MYFIAEIKIFIVVLFKIRRQGRPKRCSNCLRLTISISTAISKCTYLSSRGTYLKLFQSVMIPARCGLRTGNVQIAFVRNTHTVSKSSFDQQNTRATMTFQAPSKILLKLPADANMWTPSIVFPPQQASPVHVKNRCIDEYGMGHQRRRLKDLVSRSDWNRQADATHDSEIASLQTWPRIFRSEMWFRCSQGCSVSTFLVSFRIGVLGEST